MGLNMEWCRVIILVLVGVSLNETYGQDPTEDKERGALVGEFTTIKHNVAGKVWAADEDKLYIENFYYDGKGPDAFFWIGESEAPSDNGELIRYPQSATTGDPAKLAEVKGENIVLQLPGEKKVQDIKWFSVWCREYSENFGHVLIPDTLDPPKKESLTEFQHPVRLDHGLRSGNIIILDAKTFFIPNLHYDGKGPEAFFWVGNGPTGPDENGQKIPNEKGSLEVLDAYKGENITLQLPGKMTVYDIDYLGMWCVKFNANFGYVDIPKDLWVPPFLGEMKIVTPVSGAPSLLIGPQVFLLSSLIILLLD